jgi:hypothetical protein
VRGTCQPARIAPEPVETVTKVNDDLWTEIRSLRTAAARLKSYPGRYLEVLSAALAWAYWLVVCRLAWPTVA